MMGQQANIETGAAANISVLETTRLQLEMHDASYRAKLYGLDLDSIGIAKSEDDHARLHAIAAEILALHLDPATERYVRMSEGKYLIYLDDDREAGHYRTKLIGQEIASQIQEKGLTLTRAAAASMQIRPAPVDEKEMAATVMKNMIGKYERNNFSMSFKELSRGVIASYEAIWNYPKNHVTGYKARNSMSLSDLAGLDGEVAVRNFQMRMDVGLLVRSTADLAEALQKDFHAVLIIPVSYLTLERFPYRDYYLQYLRTLSDDLRRRIVLQIKDVGPNFPAYRLNETLRLPSKMVRSVIIEGSLRANDMNELGKSKTHAVSLALHSTHCDEKIVLRRLNHFAKKADEIGVCAMLEGVNTRSVMCAAIAAGFTYISGPIVREDQQSILNLSPFDLFALYQRDMGEASQRRM